MRFSYIKQVKGVFFKEENLECEVIVSDVDYWCVLRVRSTILSYCWVCFKKATISKSGKEVQYLSTPLIRPLKSNILFHEGIIINEEDIEIKLAYTGESFSNNGNYRIGVFLKGVLMVVFIKEKQEPFRNIVKNIVIEKKSSAFPEFMETFDLFNWEAKYQSLGRRLFEKLYFKDLEIRKQINKLSFYHNSLFFLERFIPAWIFLTILIVILFDVSWKYQLLFSLGTYVGVDFYLKKIRKYIDKSQFLIITTLAISLVPIWLNYSLTDPYTPSNTIELIGVLLTILMIALVIAKILSFSIKWIFKYLRKRLISLSNKLVDINLSSSRRPYFLYLRPTGKDTLVGKKRLQSSNQANFTGARVDGFTNSMLKNLDDCMNYFRSLIVLTDEKLPLSVEYFSNNFFSSSSLVRTNTKILVGKKERWLDLFFIIADYSRGIILTPSMSKGVELEIKAIIEKQWQRKTFILIPSHGNVNAIIKEWEETQLYYRGLGLNLPKISLNPVIYIPNTDFSIKTLMTLDFIEASLGKKKKMVNKFYNSKFKFELLTLGLPLDQNMITFNEVKNDYNIKSLLK